MESLQVLAVQFLATLGVVVRLRNQGTLKARFAAVGGCGPSAQRVVPRVLASPAGSIYARPQRKSSGSSSVGLGWGGRYRGSAHARGLKL